MKDGLQKMADTALLYALPVGILGAVFKIMHYPYANQMLMVGLSTVAIGGLLRYAAEKTPEGYSIGITIFLVCIAFLFKILHFPGSQELIELAILSAVISGIIMLFFRKGNQEENK